MMDEIPKAAVVCLDIALTGAHLLPFEPELAEVESDLAFLRKFVINPSSADLFN